MTITKVFTPKDAAEQMIRDTTVGKVLHFAFCNVPDTSVLSPDTPIASILAYELPPVNGYSRQALETSLATGPAVVWSSASKVAKRDWAPVIGVTSGNAHGWNVEILIEGGSAVSSVPITALDLGTDQLTANGHGLANGDRVILTADSGGILPTATPALTGTTELFAKAITANTFEVYTEVGLTNKVNFTAVGTGAWRVRNAKGLIKQVAIHDAAQSISGVSGPTSTTINFSYTLGTC